MSASDNKKDEGAVLPGFRFHPTDEELVGFYLRRKVEKKPISIELIKQVDIYKYDPWDLPSTIGDKECYFFCLRGRKYKNSIRPNRVTGSGFWKATGIDKPIYTSTAKASETNACIGLKKSLVFYRGSAGKGTKTDWMMHEFRLPPSWKINNNHPTARNMIAQEAEVWTLCRIFKRNASYKKYIPQWKESAFAKNSSTTDAAASSKSCSLESEISYQHQHMNVGDSIAQQNDRKPVIDDHAEERNGQLLEGQHLVDDDQVEEAPFTTTSYSSFWDMNGDEDDDHEFFRDGNWDELRSVVELAVDPSI